jgi:hypothetical protein
MAQTGIDYVYILGASHSGSTLLAMLLNAHPDVTTVGETAPGRMGDVDTYRCSCGKRIKECRFWKRITVRMRSRHPGFSLDDFGTRFAYPANHVIDRLVRCEHRGALLERLRDATLRLCPCWRASQREIMTRCHDLARAVLAESGGRVLVDSSKLAHRLKFLLRSCELNIKVIHLVRDGRAVALTYMRQDEFADSNEPGLRRGGRGMAAQATADPLPMARAAHEWRRCLEAAEHVLAGLDRSRWIRVHYEELCSDLQGTLRRIHDFLGTDHARAAACFRDAESHVIGNGMRLDTTRAVVLDERWKSVLKADELQVFDRIAGRMNNRYGYV